MSEKTSYVDQKLGYKVVRRNYSKIKSDFVAPDLLEIQKNSFEKFLNFELESLVKNIFPITSPQGKYTLDFKGIKLEPARIDEEKCRFESKTFDAPLYVDLQLVNNETGETKNIKKTKKSKAPEGIFFGNIPLMSDKGTFVINGIEKFVIAQIIRSPGFYVLNKSQVKLNNSRKRVLEGNICELLPHKGTLMLINIPTGKKYIQITARNSTGESAPYFMATTLLKAYGLSIDNIKMIYGEDNEYINATLDSEIYNEKDLFLNAEISGIINELELEINQNSSREEILKKGSPVERKLRRLLYEYLEIRNRIEENTLTKEEIKNLEFQKKVVTDAIITEKAAKDLVIDLGISLKIIESQVDEEKSCYQAIILLHLFMERFYDLSSSGRYKFNHKLRVSERFYQRILAQDIIDNKNKKILEKGTLFTKEAIKKYKDAIESTGLKISNQLKVANPFNDFLSDQNQPSMDFEYEKVLVYSKNDDMTHQTGIIGIAQNITSTSLTINDLVSAVSYAYNLSDEIGTFDDIDHLGNKRLKLIHELLKNRLNIAMVRIEKSIREKLAIADGAVNNANFVVDAVQSEEEKKKTATIKSIVNTKPFQIILKDFFNSYQLIQFIDQQNPLSELTNKRRISAMGPGGISREDPNLDIRDVHYSHYGRICPIETPEGMNIGLIMSLASFSKVDEHGFITTPYHIVKNGVVQEEIRWMTPLQDDEYVIAESNVELDAKNKILNERVVARYRGAFNVFKPSDVDFIDILPRQVVSIAASSIPFLENDDANRALMGANMQRQAVPLIKPYAPWVATGSEYKIAHDSGMAVVSKTNGFVKAVDGNKIIISDENKQDHEYKLIKFRKSNQNTCNTQSPIVELNQEISEGMTLANGPAMQNGELSLGNNVLVGFTTWRGYNFEDAIILSERLVQEDIYTSIHIDEYTIQCLQTKNGDEEITRDMPNVSDSAKRYLDEDGIIMVGAEVKEGDVLVGKVTPRGLVDLPPEEKLLQVIFGEKTKSFKESSLKVPHGGEGIVAAVKRFKNTDEENNDLGDDVIEVVKVYIVQKRKIQVGDKMAGRHGNKGVISKIVPVSDMPFLDDGTPLDVMLNPLGVPSRMNIGQILEIHLGLAAQELGKKELLKVVYENQKVEILAERFGLNNHVTQKLFDEVKNLIKSLNVKSYDELIKNAKTIDLIITLNKLGLSFDDIGYKVATPVFEGVDSTDLVNIMNEAGINPVQTNGKFRLRDGRTGEYFDGDIAVGVMYMLKLDHMVDDKIHARSVGPYSKITQQPLGGKSQNGGQRFGEMEVWALEAYGAAHNLYEILTIKSDDVRGRNLTYNAIIKGHDIPSGGTPESFKLLTKQLQGLGLYIEVIDENGKETDINNFIGHEYDDLMDKNVMIDEDALNTSGILTQVDELSEDEEEDFI